MSNKTLDIALILDCRGLVCPEPILKIKSAMKTVDAGQTVRMESTDPGSVSDMESWARQTGNSIVEQSRKGDTFIFYVRKNG